MESNHRYFARRAHEERRAAQRAMTPQAQEWHRSLAEDFARRAEQHAPMLQQAL